MTDGRRGMRQQPMSTLAYATLTNRRDEAQPGSSSTTESPGVKTYVDAMAALVPAEVLTLHALIISYTTTVSGSTTTIVEASRTTLSHTFWVLLAISIGLYILGRLADKKWDAMDYLRVFIPPAAFVVWTMLQRATAFDAAFPQFAQSPRTVYGLIGAVVLGALAGYLGLRADKKPPPSAAALSVNGKHGKN
jgi:hypothetical protein